MAQRDPGSVALRRGIRVCVVTPVVFAFFLLVVGSHAGATFASFGSFALLAFADFGGRPGPRARAYLSVTAVGAVLAALGTTLSTSAWAAATGMVVVAAAVRFVGFFGGPFAAAVSPLILPYVLGATIPGPASATWERLAGWFVAGAVSTVAALVLVPRRDHLLVSAAALRACRTVADAFERLRTGESSSAERAHVVAAVDDLRKASVAYRRRGPSAHSLAVTFMIDELRLMALLVEQPSPFLHGRSRSDIAGRAAGQLRAAARALEGGPLPDADTLDVDRAVVRDEATARVARQARTHTDPGQVVADFDTTYLERLILYLSTSVEANVCVLLTGRRPEITPRGLAPLEAPDVARGSTLRRFVRLVAAHAVPTSAWLQDSVRAGVALGAAVLIADVASLEQGYWVALATLAVLRSNSFDTGRNAAEAAAGAAIGFALSATFFAVVGLDRPALWVVVVVGCFLAAWLPAVGGFVAAQTAFTVLVVALLTLVRPDGWHAGVVRIEDIVVGTSVAFGAGLLFWPRRAVRLLRACTVDLYRTLADATRTTASTALAVRASELRAHAAFASYLDERRHSPAMDPQWSTMLGVAGLGRTGLRFVTVHRAKLNGSPACTRLDAWTADFGAAWQTLGDALANGTGAARPPPDARTVADATRGTAVSAIESIDSDGVDAAIAVLLWRGWLIEQASLLHDAARAADQLATPESPRWG